MSFTYALASTDPDILRLSHIRLEIADMDEGSGPRPNPERTNFTDAELQYFIASHDTDNLILAAIFDNLAAAWTSVPRTWLGNTGEDPTALSNRYRNLAAHYRRKSGALFNGFSTTLASSNT